MGCNDSKPSPAVVKAAVAKRAPARPRKKNKSDPVLMFHLGTNNWQRQGEFAPGSGILHASFHASFNSMPKVTCYSIYPSKTQTDPEDDHLFKMFKLEHDIPICESVSPNSNFRWHSMNDEQYASYLKRLEDEVCAFMDKAEEREKREFDYIISHHAFTNAMTAAKIVERRAAAGKTKLRHFNFVHGTALKMYIKEKEGDPEYPPRFLKLCQDSGVFANRERCSGVWVNSDDYVAKFLDCFPEYPKEFVVFSRIGVDQNIFKPQGTKIEDLKKHLREPQDEEKLPGIKRVVCFCGKFADWKRLDVVIHAAQIWEEKFEDLGLVVIGTGPDMAVEFYQGLSIKLGLKRAIFLGAKPQDALAEVFSMSELGIFPSYKEPFGMVFIECMACGTPVIGAKSGGPLEFVRPGQGALIEEEAEWRTQEGSKKLGARVAEQVTLALEENWKGKTKGPSCVKFVSDNYSTKTQCEKMLDQMRDWAANDTGRTPSPEEGEPAEGE